MRSWEKHGKTIVAVNFTLEREALEILWRYSPSDRRYGDFLSRLLYEYEARRQGAQEERDRLRQQLDAVVGAVDAA